MMIEAVQGTDKTITLGLEPIRPKWANQVVAVALALNRICSHLEPWGRASDGIVTDRKGKKGRNG